MALVDRTGRLVRFTVRPGNFYEGNDVEILVNGIPAEELIADKAYDSGKIRSQLASAGIEAVIPQRRRAKVLLWYDPDRYAERHLVENYFARIKQFRRIATRYEKTAACFAGMVNLAALYLETKAINLPVQE
jgi:transposase